MKKDTSWSSVGKWYDERVASKGHLYHQEVIFPKLKQWLKWKKGDALLDLGCGQGVFSRQLPEGVDYCGIDLAKPLIKEAQKRSFHTFLMGDATSPLPTKKKDFSHALFLLSLQNMSDGKSAIQNAKNHLREKGLLYLILNHPCYRIPRQSSWGIDEGKKIQYRRVDRYLSPLEIPIQMHPSKKGKSEKTFSYHVPLSTLSDWLRESGFVILRMEEWTSPKKSGGLKAKMENRARDEFPLFLAIEARFG